MPTLQREDAATAAAAGVGGAAGAGAYLGAGYAVGFGNRYRYKRPGVVVVEDFPDNMPPKAKTAARKRGEVPTRTVETPSGLKDFLDRKPDTRPQGQQTVKGARAKRLVEQRHRLDADQKKILETHKKAHGIPSTARGDWSKADWVGFNRSYPKELPGARASRVLSYTHGTGTKSMRLGLALAGLVGAGGAGAAAHHAVRKSSETDLQMPSQLSIGIPVARRFADPISPLSMYASSAIMLDNAAALMGRNLNRRQRRAATSNVYQFVGAKDLAYTPLRMIG